MSCLKYSKDCAPTTGCPLTAKVGVDGTPSPLPRLYWSVTNWVYFPESRQELKAAVSNFMSAAKAFKLSLLKAPWFSPF